MGRQTAGWRRLAAALAAACLAGSGGGALWQPQPAAAETVRELSWFLRAMHVKDAHRISRGDRITVAVVDTGVDASHPDLRGRVLPGTEIGDDASPKSGADGREDTDGHGTGMASLIAGTGRSGANSLLGVAPRARILPVRITQTSDGSFQPGDVYAGVRWAIDHGAKIVNMSLGGERSTDAPWKKQLVNYAISKDVVLIAAAGNTGKGDRKVAEPASIPGVVAVSGVTRSGRFWRGSARGPEVVVSAPAEGLPMAAPTSVSDSGYVLADGTSGAAALVSGVAALIRSAFPDISANDVVNRLIRTAQDRGAAGRDQEYGFGVIDARMALEGEVPGVRHHPLVSPEASTSDGSAAVRLSNRRISYGVLLVVGGFGGTVLALLLAAYVLHVGRRSRQVVIAGVVPGAGPFPNAYHGGPHHGPYQSPGPYGPPPYGPQPGMPWPPGSNVPGHHPPIPRQYGPAQAWHHPQTPAASVAPVPGYPHPGMIQPGVGHPAPPPPNRPDQPPTGAGPVGDLPQPPPG